MKKLYFTALLLGAFTFGAQAQTDLVDDFEEYDIGYLSPQADHWRTWSGDMGTSEDGLVLDDEAFSGSQSLYIDDSGEMDLIFLVPNAPSTGIYMVQWHAFIPAGKSGYWNMQGGLTASGAEWRQHLMGGNVYLNCSGNSPGEGGVTGVIDCSSFEAVFTYPEDEWFKVTCVYDLDMETWSLSINDVLQFQDYPFEFGTEPFQALAGIDFYSASSNNHMYVDDIIAGPDVLGTEAFENDVFAVYPNPVQDVLNIASKTEVEKVTVYDILGKVVLQATPGVVSPQINMSALPSGTYMVKVTIGKNSKVVKVLK